MALPVPLQWLLLHYLLLIMKGSPSAECCSRGHRYRPLVAPPKSIHLRYVPGRVQEGYITKLLGRRIHHGGQIVNGPLYQYPLHPIGGWVISKDISLQQQTSCDSHKFATGFSDAEPQRGQSTPRSTVRPRKKPRWLLLQGMLGSVRGAENTNSSHTFRVGMHHARSSK